ncbi:hypothetical protein [Thiomonas bhubaneswarensis]|uniref:Uncharacterized protein n=1 Tax=Thiomonas bhubaneswarensis TaxID=339866 RepID=A0A0K6I0W6_9BURK|nr:hypothetical protein [Thiomonas bhubaneswarensis]CUA96716.1 hypothetical protein Ga0061069_104254 [Thiomonas bhubaneswarensis]
MNQAVSNGNQAVSLVQGFTQLQSTQGYSLGNGGNIGLSSISSLSTVSAVDVSTLATANSLQQSYLKLLP